MNASGGHGEDEYPVDLTIAAGRSKWAVYHRIFEENRNGSTLSERHLPKC